MIDSPADGSGRFCWLDLATSDASAAQAFYAQAFGWRFRDTPALGGHYTRVSMAGREFASMYRLSRTQLAHGVPSHWTPYVRVHSADDSADRIAALGGDVRVAPFDVPGTARIALIEDPVGALVGLWEPVPSA